MTAVSGARGRLTGQPCPEVEEAGCPLNDNGALRGRPFERIAHLLEAATLADLLGESLAKAQNAISRQGYQEN